MSKFNTVVKTTTKTTNLAGGVGYKESPELELVSLLLTSFVEDKFYESADSQVARLAGLVNTIKDKQFLAKAAIYARNEFGMRSITHALMGELVSSVRGEEWIKNAINKVIARPDDMLEILAYYWKNDNTRPVPNSIKKGFNLALHKFNEYELAKYRGENKAVKLVDVINLVHPRGEIFGKIVKGELKNTQTWEAKLSAAGNTDDVDENKKQAWKDLLEGNKLGYLAAIRNIRNIQEQAPECIDLLCALLTKDDLVKKAKIFPFQLNTAKEYATDRRIISALNKAMEISLSNVPVYEGKTCIVLDTSGSMDGKPAEIGSLFAAALYKSNPGADVIVFGSNAEYMTPNPDDALVTIAKSIRENGMGGTNFSTIPYLMTQEKKVYDRIILLSDMQGWEGSDGDFPRHFNAYKTAFKTNPFLYSFDLTGHGTLKYPESKIFALAGFSDKVFDIMGLLEQDKNALVSKIKEIVL